MGAARAHARTHTDLDFLPSSLPHTCCTQHTHNTNLRQAVHPPLASVLHEVSQPFLSVICLLLTEGLKQSNHNSAAQPPFTTYFYCMVLVWTIMCLKHRVSKSQLLIHTLTLIFLIIDFLFKLQCWHFDYLFDYSIVFILMHVFGFNI